MKKILFAISAALLALAACNKEIEIVNPENNNVQKVSALTFTSARPQLDADDLKTSWDGSAIVWTSGVDKIKVGFTFDGAWWAQSMAYAEGNANPNDHIKFYQSDAVDIDGTDASIGKFSVPTANNQFSGSSENGNYIFYAVYPASSTSSNNQDNAPVISVTLNSNQTPAADSFDGSADIMVGKSESINSTGLPSEPIDLAWTRVVAHGLFTLKDFQNVVSGETISKVVFTAQDGANLTGKQSVNIADGTVTPSDASNTITLDGANLAFVPENGSTNLKVWLSVIPATLTSLKVEVVTDKATYVREITGISKALKGNTCNKLGINMAKATRTAVEVEYEWVKTELSAISLSDVFVIVGNNGNNYAMSNDNGTSAPTAVAVNVSNDKLASAPAEKLQWNLSNSSGSYTFYPNGTTETWLYCTNTNNGVKVGTNDNKAFTLDGGYLKNTATGRYIGIYNSADWRCYTSTGTNIDGQTFAFYVRTEAGPVKPTPTISFGTPTTQVNIGETVTNVATISVSGLTVTYESSNVAVASVNSASGEVTGVAAGTATITASFAGDDTYNAASATYNISVIDPNANNGSAEKPYTASEAAELALNGSTASDVYVKGIISGIVTEYSSEYNNISFNISDDGTPSGAQFQIYRTAASSADDYKVGDAVVFKGTLKNYNNTAEFEAGSTKIAQLHAPAFTPDGGYFSTDSQSISISADEGSVIYYTIDGANPTSSSTVYSSSISISATTTLKAIAIKDGVVTGVVSRLFTKSNGETPSLKYTLDGTDPQGESNNGYAVNHEITSNYITWFITGNLNSNPWRIGGKNLSNVNRAFYSADAISSNISSIEVESGTATATVNSLTITVHNTANDAASGSNPIATKTVTSGIISGTVTLTKSDEASWAGKYYRIVYNVTAGSSNQYVQFKSAKFYGIN